MSDIIGLKRGTVKVVDYDLDWPKEFEAVKQRLLKTFGHKIVAIEHIGSTSILGLAAKPIIDIVAVVKSFDNLPQFVDGLQKVDYEYTPERMFDNRKVAIWCAHSKHYGIQIIYCP
jgi:GrpB-like predicted nucleotidyltransferase (UPF0157 family)